MSRKEVVILGAGLAGLSCAYHLKSAKNIRATTIEKSNSPGGTARSIKIGDFVFDITGHLLHLHHPYTKHLIKKLLKNNLYLCVRKAAIYSNDRLTPYPFQAHTYGLPKNVVRECVEGFRKAVQLYSDDSKRSTSLPFDVWSTRTFGKGIHTHFMKPYNEKLYQVSLKEMTAEWCGMFVPQPKLEDVLRGSKKDTAKVFGYNATFLYPQRGGIQVLAEALAKNLKIQFNTEVEEVFWKEKKIRTSHDGHIPYDELVSSIPLVELLKKMKDLPERIKNLIPSLRWTSVLCVNLGVNRANISDKSWIYFPEKKYVFYRVGFPMNFTPHAAPKGCSSMYVETAYPPEEKPPFERPEFLQKVREDLQRCGLLQANDKILVADFIPIRYAYVLYTPNRKEIMDQILSFLHANQIDSIGRYGAWKYSFMEEAILDGKKTAEKILVHAAVNSCTF